MTLYQKLQTAQSEEDVKDAYISALKLKKVTKGLIDIQTEEIWFEAKHKPTDVYTMFTQLLYYVCHAHKGGENVPPLLCVIETKKPRSCPPPALPPSSATKKSHGANPPAKSAVNSSPKSRPTSTTTSSFTAWPKTKPPFCRPCATALKTAASSAPKSLRIT